MMRLTAVAFILFAGAAQAQTPLTGTTAPLGSPNTGPATSDYSHAAAPSHAAGRRLEDRFAAANTTHDGHLTLEQARSHMPSVARNFTAIDKDNKGYVTVDQIRAFRREQASERRAARRAEKTTQ